MDRFKKLHDASSRGFHVLAGALLVLCVSLYVYEVIARYFFGSPTTWSGEAVQYSLAIIIFCALPDITRRSKHVAIEIIPEGLSGAPGLLLARFNLLIGAIATGVSSLIIGREALKQFDNGLLTNAANPIPRWWITSFIAVGLASSALYFLRHIREGSK